MDSERDYTVTTKQVKRYYTPDGHYVPQFILKNFANKQKIEYDKTVFIFNKNDSTVKLKHIKKLFCQKYALQHKEDDSIISFEEHFSKKETEFDKLCQKIIHTKRISEQDLTSIIGMTAMQMARSYALMQMTKNNINPFEKMVDITTSEDPNFIRICAIPRMIKDAIEIISKKHIFLIYPS